MRGIILGIHQEPRMTPRAINVTTENVQVGPSPPVSPVKLPALQTESAGYETRSGRISKKLVKMNLEIVRETRL